MQARRRICKCLGLLQARCARHPFNISKNIVSSFQRCSKIKRNAHTASIFIGCMVYGDPRGNLSLFSYQTQYLSTAQHHGNESTATGHHGNKDFVSTFTGVCVLEQCGCRMICLGRVSTALSMSATTPSSVTVMSRYTELLFHGIRNERLAFFL